MQILTLKNNSFYFINKKCDNFHTDKKIEKSSSFSFPSYKMYSFLRPISFKAIGDCDGLTKEEIAARRKKRKAEEKAEKQRKYDYRQRMKELNKPVSTIDETKKTIDILAKAAYPANVLSNFKRVEPPFYINDVPCHSLEGFLQSLKTPDEELQKGLCLKSGSTARRLGRMLTQKDNWKENQVLYWKGVPYHRNSQEYIELVKNAFSERFNASEEYRDALKSTEGYSLTHSCGSSNPEETVLTEQEFISILDELREKL